MAETRKYEENIYYRDKLQWNEETTEKGKSEKRSGAKKADFKIIHTHCERARNFVNKLNLFKIKRKISGSNYKKCILKMYHHYYPIIHAK